MDLSFVPLLASVSIALSLLFAFLGCCAAEQASDGERRISGRFRVCT